jgi:membrane-associated phospholipid phosphatase
MSLLIFLAQIGYFGPVTLTIIAMILVIRRVRSPLFPLVLFTIWDMLNYCLNAILKKTTMESRPSCPVSINSLDRRDENDYGMPSGHAQQVFSKLVIIVRERGLFSYLSMFVYFQTLLTIWQRYKFRKHTTSQLFVGSCVGMVSGMSHQVLNSRFGN